MFQRLKGRHAALTCSLSELTVVDVLAIIALGTPAGRVTYLTRALENLHSCVAAQQGVSFTSKEYMAHNPTLITYALPSPPPG
eukprot:5371805-Prymnesium_polylepis.1